MNEFRILSIDELDEEFVTRLRVNVSVSQPVTPIPETEEQQNIFSTIEPVEPIKDDADKNIDYINDYLSATIRPASYPSPEISDNAPRPIIPLGQGKAFYAPDKNELHQQMPILTEDDFEEEEPVKKNKGLKGLIAAKIVCIIMLALTLIIFVAGCFISIYLNNDGVSLKGICFNTLASDVDLSGKKLNKGDLIISQKTNYDEYSESLNMPIAIPVNGVKNEGCEIEYIYSVSNIIEDEATVITYDPETNEVSDKKHVADKTYGIVRYYFPFIGGALVFALNNVILVCVLFVLMAAFWCLLMILVEKNIKKKKELID